MAVKPISLSIDTINNDTVLKYENVRKGDTLKFNISIFEGSESKDLAGESMHIVLAKPDGYAVEKIINSITGNNFDVEFDVQATLAIGDVEGIIEIISTNAQGATTSDITNVFTFKVKPNPSGNIIIQSSNQIETLTQIINLINSYNANADNLAIQNNLTLANITELKTDIATGNTLTDRLETDITVGTEVTVRLESDISIGNQLDSNLKQDIATGGTVHNNLLIDIANGNDIISKLPTLNFNTILSYIELMNTMLSGSRLTDGDGNYLTDGNGNYLTMA